MELDLYRNQAADTKKRNVEKKEPCELVQSCEISHISSVCLKGKKIVSGFRETKQYFIFFFILTTCFDQLTIIGLSLQNLE
jgi:hypothetical protein